MKWFVGCLITTLRLAAPFCACRDGDVTGREGNTISSEVHFSCFRLHPVRARLWMMVKGGRAVPAHLAPFTIAFRSMPGTVFVFCFAILDWGTTTIEKRKESRERSRIIRLKYFDGYIYWAKSSWSWVISKLFLVELAAPLILLSSTFYFPLHNCKNISLREQRSYST